LFQQRNMLIKIQYDFFELFRIVWKIIDVHDVVSIVKIRHDCNKFISYIMFL
jgi:hypothetical protein